MASASMLSVFAHLQELVRQGQLADDADVMGLLRQIAEVACAAMPLHAALTGQPALHLHLEEGAGRAPLDTPSQNPLGAFNVLTETVGQDFIKEIVEFFRTTMRKKTPKDLLGTLPRPPVAATGGGWWATDPRVLVLLDTYTFECDAIRKMQTGEWTARAAIRERSTGRTILWRTGDHIDRRQAEGLAVDRVWADWVEASKPSVEGPP